jgi:predicted NBD/HSP70 family sugar kinase
MKLGFDIGATHLRIAELTSEGIGRTERLDTPHVPREATRLLASLAHEIAGDTIESITGGVAAIVEQGIITFSTNLPSWKGFDFRTALSERVHAPVTLINDVELDALGEALYGAGKGYTRVAYIGLGTGVGTALVQKGIIEAHSSDGIVRDTIIALSDGDTLEERIGGRALAAQHGVSPAELSQTVWQELAPLLAEGVANAARLWSPDCIVLGGSLMNEESGFRLEEVQRTLSPELSRRLVRAALGDASGLYGAKALAGM